MLAERLAPKYRYENCAVLALNDGGVMVGAQIASALHCVLTLLNSAEIMLPREPEPVAGITANGVVTYNSQYSDGEIDEINSEFLNLIEQEKLELMHELNHIPGGASTVNKAVLHGRNVIVVSDGLKTGFPIDLAAAFLKPIAIDRLIMAVPLASVKAVDRMHILADELYCLDVIGDYRDTEHYYEKQDVPDHQTVLDTINDIVLQWSN